MRLRSLLARLGVFFCETLYPHRNGVGVPVRTLECRLDMDFAVCCKGTMSSRHMRRFDRNLVLI